MVFTCIDSGSGHGKSEETTIHFCPVESAGDCQSVSKTSALALETLSMKRSTFSRSGFGHSRSDQCLQTRYVVAPPKTGEVRTSTSSPLMIMTRAPSLSSPAATWQRLAAQGLVIGAFPQHGNVPSARRSEHFSSDRRPIRENLAERPACSRRPAPRQFAGTIPDLGWALGKRISAGTWSTM